MGLLLLIAALVPALLIGVLVGIVMAVKTRGAATGKFGVFLKWAALTTFAMWLALFGLFTHVMVLDR